MWSSEVDEIGVAWTTSSEARKVGRGRLLCGRKACKEQGQDLTAAQLWVLSEQGLTERRGTLRLGQDGERTAVLQCLETPQHALTSHVTRRYSIGFNNYALVERQQEDCGGESLLHGILRATISMCAPTESFDKCPEGAHQAASASCHLDGRPPPLPKL